MSTDLRASFKERHCKRFYEAIDMVHSLAKKGYPNKAREKIGREALVTPMPQPDVMGLSSVPTIEEEAGPTLRGAFDGAIPIEEVSNHRTLLHLPPFLARMK